MTMLLGRYLISLRLRLLGHDIIIPALLHCLTTAHTRRLLSNALADPSTRIIDDDPDAGTALACAELDQRTFGQRGLRVYQRPVETG